VVSPIPNLWKVIKFHGSKPPVIVDLPTVTTFFGAGVICRFDPFREIGHRSRSINQPWLGVIWLIGSTTWMKLTEVNCFFPFFFPVTQWPSSLGKKKKTFRWICSMIIEEGLIAAVVAEWGHCATKWHLFVKTLDHCFLVSLRANRVVLGSFAHSWGERLVKINMPYLAWKLLAYWANRWGKCLTHTIWLCVCAGP